MSRETVKMLLASTLAPAIMVFGGILAASIHEAIIHDVSLWDALFIESWKDTRTPDPAAEES